MQRLNKSIREALTEIIDEFNRHLKKTKVTLNHRMGLYDCFIEDANKRWRTALFYNLSPTEAYQFLASVLLMIKTESGGEW